MMDWIVNGVKVAGGSTQGCSGSTEATASKVGSMSIMKVSAST